MGLTGPYHKYRVMEWFIAHHLTLCVVREDKREVGSGLEREKEKKRKREREG